MQMKRLFLVLFLFPCFSLAQVPQLVNYQGVARDNAGNAFTIQPIGLQLTIHSTTANGAIVYQETQNPTTNQFGLFNIQLGSGTVVQGVFSSIAWGSDLFFIEVEMDETGGTNYQQMGTSQLISVPYALYAETAGNGPIGPTGPTGVQGTTGSQGLQGSTGLPGPQGATGAIGPTGQIGPAGPTGATGLQGSTGTQGIQGPTGPSGGPQGPTGPPGSVTKTIYTGVIDTAQAGDVIKNVVGVLRHYKEINIPLVDTSDFSVIQVWMKALPNADDVPGTNNTWIPYSTSPFMVYNGGAVDGRMSPDFVIEHGKLYLCYKDWSAAYQWRIPTTGEYRIVILK